MNSYLYIRFWQLTFTVEEEKYHIGKMQKEANFELQVVILPSFSFPVNEALLAGSRQTLLKLYILH